MYRKATRAALLLVPLLGVINFLSIIYPPTGSWLSFAVWSYFTQFLVSFQGLYISLLYCFFNNEVFCLFLCLSVSVCVCLCVVKQVLSFIVSSLHYLPSWLLDVCAVILQCLNRPMNTLSRYVSQNVDGGIYPRRVGITFSM